MKGDVIIKNKVLKSDDIKHTLKDLFTENSISMEEYYMKNCYAEGLYTLEEEAIHKKEIIDLGKSKGYIPMNRNYTLVLGSNASLLLAELCDRYDWYAAKNEINEYGEFFYTVTACEINTGLSTREQNTAIKKLIEHGFIDKPKLRGMPKKRYFKLSKDIPILLSELCVKADEIRTKLLENSNEDLTKLYL